MVCPSALARIGIDQRVVDIGQDLERLPAGLERRVERQDVRHAEPDDDLVVRRGGAAPAGRPGDHGEREQSGADGAENCGHPVPPYARPSGFPAAHPLCSAELK
jgi:hypothetical protein